MATADKYDRQLRLWGPRGQRKLMQSHILLINANAAGTETLKNLVLPGVGKFTVLDEKVVSLQDASVNFFLPEKEVGRFRADVASETLCEMNPDVKGSSIVSTLQKEIEKDAGFLSSFSVVVMANPTPSDLSLASSICWDTYLPLVVVKSYGYIGECRLQLREHFMVESKPDPESVHLRMSTPFESLEKYYNSIDFANQTPEEFAHTPYIAILRHFVEKWSLEHGGKKPSTRAEIKELKEMLKSVGTPVEYYEDGTKKQSYLRDNYKEAIQNLSKYLEPAQIPISLQELFSMSHLLDVNCDNLKIANFKIMLIALKKYIEEIGEGVHWPLSGVLPDMTCTSDAFMILQNIYKEKAEQDRLVFQHIVEKLLSECNRGSSEISEEEIQIFCRNILNLRYLSSECSIKDRLMAPHVDFARDVLCEETYWDDPVQTPLLYHYLLLACDEFYKLHGRYPGSFSSNVTESQEEDLLSDANALWKVVCHICQAHAVPCSSNESTVLSDDTPHVRFDHAQEVCRYGGIELHNISSLVGGVAAQECVKIMTHLFVPMNNCYIYNGIAGCSSTVET